MAQRLNQISVCHFQPGKYPVTPALSLRFPFPRIAAVAGFARPCNLNPNYMTNKNAKNGNGKTVFIIAVDFRRQSKNNVSADVERQFETCSFYAGRQNLNVMDSVKINHQDLLEESDALNALCDKLIKSKIKTVLIRKSNRLMMTSFFMQVFSNKGISIVWVTVNYDRNHKSFNERRTDSPLIFRYPSSWEQLL